MPIITDILLKGLKPPAAGRIEIKDDRCAGLEFRLTRAGAASWSLRFRDPQTGKPLRSTIGSYPAVGIAAARERGNALRKDVAAGINPVVRKYRDRQDASAKTFKALAYRYLHEHARRFKRSAHADERCLEMHILPVWGKRRYDQIERADVIELVERIIGNGTPVQANRVQALVSKIFSFAVDASLVKFNPCSRLRKRGAETRKTRVLSDDEIRQFWSRSVLPPVSRRVGLALRLALLTGCRSGEVAGIHRKELSDLDAPGTASWLIPADRSKNGRAHFVPLSEPARAVVLSALELIADDAEYLFPSPVEHAGPISGHALTTAMRRMAARIEGAALKTWQAEPPSPHDLRRSIATRLSQMGTLPETVSAILNHTRGDVTGRHYDHYQRASEKRVALDAWAAAVTGIVEGKSGNVVRLAVTA
jgi:integrase